jgi:1-acyl-sn-glycerol-3-phosphate acyltransferase
MNPLLKTGFVLLAKVVSFLILGLCIYNPTRLPLQGPAILVANHNSHLDTFALMSLFPLSMATQIRPIANADYFLHRNRLLAWFSRQVLDIIPLACESSSGGNRQGDGSHRSFFNHCAEALAQQQILILYPEGSRGQPESFGEFKSGIAHLAKRHPDVPIVPIFLRGFGKAMPKGDPLLVPFVCKAHIGEALFWNGHKQEFLAQLNRQMHELAGEPLEEEGPESCGIDILPVPTEQARRLTYKARRNLD